jgi:hypothetical protein
MMFLQNLLLKCQIICIAVQAACMPCLQEEVAIASLQSAELACVEETKHQHQ